MNFQLIKERFLFQLGSTICQIKHKANLTDEEAKLNKLSSFAILNISFSKELKKNK